MCSKRMFERLNKNRGIPDWLCLIEFEKCVKGDVKYVGRFESPGNDIKFNTRKRARTL